MSWMVILTIIIVGLLFLLLEILVVPGTTVIGFLGAAMMVFGVYSVYSQYGVVTGTYALGGTLVFAVSAIVMALKSNTWKKAMLNTDIGGKVNVFEEDSVKPGDEGVAVTRLNPMGKALINEEYYEVTSKNNLLDENTEIIVTKVEGNKIIVKPKSE